MAGQRSSQYAQQSYPNFTQSGAGPSVTVYYTGTTTKVDAIYSDNTGTILANPFPCTSASQYHFFANVTVTDLLFSGTGISAFTRGAVPGGGLIVWATDYGADSTGARDSLAALQSAYVAAGTTGTVMIPSGTYKVSAQWAMSTSGVSVICESQAAVLQYTGSGAIDSVAFVGSASTFLYNQRFEGCTVKGNSHSTYTVHADKTNHSVLQNLDLKGAITSALFIDQDVADLFQSITVSAATGSFSYVPVNGIQVANSNTNTIIQPVVEMGYVSGSSAPTVGILMDTAAEATTVSGGTSEANGINIKLSSLSSNTLIQNMDDEVPCTDNLVDAGTANIVSGGLHAGVSSTGGCTTTPISIHYLSTANAGNTSGITGDQIVVDSGAKVITLGSNVLANNWVPNGDEILDSGTATLILPTNRHCCGGALLPGKFPGGNTSGTVNVVSSLLGSTTMDLGPNVNVLNNGSVNYALNMTLLRSDGTQVPVAAGLIIHIISLPADLRAGANTLTLNGVGPYPILNALGGNLAGVYGASLPLTLSLTGANWFVEGAQ